MNENIIKSKENRRKIYISLLVSVICLIGLTYALFTIFLKQTENNSLATRTCFSTSLTEETSKITLNKAYPLTHEKGLETTPFTFKLTNNCDKPVKVYITIDSTYRTSTSSSYLSDSYIRENINLKGETTAPSVVLTEQPLKEIDNGNQGYVIKETWLEANEEKEYDLRLWMDESVTVEQGLNKTWKGSVVVSAVAETKLPTWDNPEDGTLLAAIKRDNTVTETLSQPGKEVSAHTLDDVPVQTAGVSSTHQAYYITYGTGWEANGTKFNLTGTAVTSNTYANSYSTLVGKYLTSNSYSAGSSTAGTMKTTTNLSALYYVISATSDSFTYKMLTSNKNATEAVLASTEDDYGTSYYFRGAVTNNFVEYANMCWKIVRVTGDGSIKLVLYNYNGLTDSNMTPSSSTPCNVTGDNYALARYEGDTYESEFNASNDDDNAHIGLMYGTTESSSYADAHANTNPSTMLTNLNKWYTNVLSKQAGFSDNQLADTIWCNDKTNVTDTTYNPWNWSNLNGLGYGTNKTFYGATQRLVSTNGSAGGTGPALSCQNDNNGGKLSRFTVSDTVYGNGALSGYAKVGLLTADEIAFAGGAFGTSNSTYYIKGNTNSFWWALSPTGFGGINDSVLDVIDNYAYVYGVDGGFGKLGDNSVDNNNPGVRPSLSLQSGVKISSGNGSATNPYKIAA